MPLQPGCLEALKRDMGGKIEGIFKRSANRVYVTVKPENVPAVSEYVYKNFDARLATASGTDLRSGIEVLYHWFLRMDKQFISVRTQASKPFPELPSLANLLPAANWIEREIHDILGVTFAGHPDPRRLLLAESWPEGVYPLRREFEGLDES